MKKIFFLAAAVPLLWATATVAQTQAQTYPPGISGASEGHRVTDVGRTAKADLELQRSGRASVANQPMSQAAATRVYDRYLKSFTHDIPEEFKEDSFGTSNGGGG